MSRFELSTYPSINDLRNLRDWLNENLDKPNFDFDGIQFRYDRDFDDSNDAEPSYIRFESFDVNEREKKRKLEMERRLLSNKEMYSIRLIDESRQLRESLTNTQNHLTRAEIKLAKISKGINNPACKDKPAFLLNLKRATDCVQNLKNKLVTLQNEVVQLDFKLEKV